MGFGGILVILGFRDILVIFWVSRVFWSFLGFGGILVIFLGFEGILVIFRFQGYFGHFLDLEGILVILSLWGAFR